MVLAGAAPAANAATPATGSRLKVPLAVHAGPALRSSSGARPEGGSSWAQGEELDGNGYDLFGFSVAVSGTTMVVGAPNDAGGNGAAYVYTGSGTGWTQKAELTASDGAYGDSFGEEVAIYGDTIVVGAAGRNAYAGAAYVFTGSGSSWTQDVEIDDPGATSNDEFSVAIAITSNSILIGALGADSNAGAVYVYANAPGYVEKSLITDPGATANDAFGWTLAASGKTMVVGAPGVEGASDGHEPFTGAVYVYSEVRGGWVEKTELTAPNGQGCVSTCGNSFGLIYGDYFGYSVALSGKTIAVGAPFATAPMPASSTGPQPDGAGTGTAYVFTGSGSSWTQKSEVYDPAEVTANTDDWFGYDVAVAKGATVVVNAPGDYQGFESNIATGAAFVFSSDGSTWPSSPTELVSSDGGPGDYFGYGLATSGSRYVMVGQAYSSPGAVYVFKK
jgi:hypothetical protein